MKTLKQTINFSHKQRGVTLVELMIAVTISSIVMIGISSVYTSSKRSYKLQEEFSRLQENGRFAINHITRFVRSAGYSGCSSALNSMINNFKNPTEELLFQTGIEGYESVGSDPGSVVPALDEYPSVTTTATDFASVTSNISVSLIGKLKPLPSSDIIVARVGGSRGLEITETNNSANFRINLTSVESGACPDGADRVSGICPGDSLLISDCQKSVVFLVSTIDPFTTPPSAKINHAATTINGKQNIETSFQFGPAGANYQFPPGSEVMKVTTKFFYIGKGINGPALFIKDGDDATGSELVEGIESMQVLYGEDTDATPDNIPNRYVAASDVQDFANVVAVRVSILLRSVKELPWRTAGSKTYLLGGMDNDTAVRVTSPSDKRLRKVMTTTIRVRNRAFSL